MSKEHFERTKQFHELKDTDGEPIYNATSFAYGFTTVSKIVSRERCNSYVKKYFEKALGSTDVFKKRFYYSSNLNKPNIVKKLLDVDIEETSNINYMDCIYNNAIVKNAQGKQYQEKYNVLQVKIDNEIKHFVENGLIPASTEENKMLEVLFNE